MGLFTTSMPVWAIVMSAGVAVAQPFTWNDNRATEPTRSVSFVRTYDNKIAFTDGELRVLISANVGPGKRWSSIDVVMQQCYAGGFLNDLAFDTAAPLTLATACDWDEVAWNAQEAPGFALALENFTRAWVAAAQANPQRGVRELAFRGRLGDWTGPIDRNFRPRAPEHPQYVSRDGATVGGPNDLRTITDAPGRRLFTGIGIFGFPQSVQGRHFTNALRVANLVTPRTAQNRVAAIYSDGTVQNIGNSAPIRPDSGVFPILPIRASTSVANVTKILDGSIYAGLTRQDGDRLLLYVTGHGGRAQFAKPTFVEVIDSDGDGTEDIRRYGVCDECPILEQREAGGVPPESFNANLFGDSDDPAQVDQIQLYLRQPLPMGATISINSVDVTLQTTELTVPDQVRDLPDLNDHTQTPPAGAVYQVLAPRADVIGLSTSITIQFGGLGALIADPALLQAVDVWSGDGEAAFIFDVSDTRPPCDADINQDGNADQGDINDLINLVAGGPGPMGVDPDFDRDGVIGAGDIDALINVVAGGACP